MDLEEVKKDLVEGSTSRQITVNALIGYFLGLLSSVAVGYVVQFYGVSIKPSYYLVIGISMPLILFSGEALKRYMSKGSFEKALDVFRGVPNISSKIGFIVGAFSLIFVMMFLNIVFNV